MKKVIFGLIVLLGLAPVSASALTIQEEVDVINAEFDSNALYGDFASEVAKLGFDIDEIIKIVDTYSTADTVYLHVRDDGNSTLNLRIEQQSGSSYISKSHSITKDLDGKHVSTSGSTIGRVVRPDGLPDADKTVYKITTHEGIPINRKAYKPGTHESVVLKYSIAPSLSFHLSETQDTIDYSTRKYLNIKPVVSANVPYSLTINHDGNIVDEKGDTVLSGVTYSFEDAKSSSVSGNVLNYNYNITDTIIKATPSELDLAAGKYSDDIDIILSQQGVS